MAAYFHDTSAAVKHYRAELGTAKVDGLLSDTASSHFLSALGVVEVGHNTRQYAVMPGIAADSNGIAPHLGYARR